METEKTPDPDGGFDSPEGETQSAPTFSTGNLPGSPEDWPLYQKHALTRAIRIEGPFTVETSEGPLRCENGYLAIDARGYPYPIAADEFEQIYGPPQEAEDPYAAALRAAESAGHVGVTLLATTTQADLENRIQQVEAEAQARGFTSLGTRRSVGA